MYDAIVVGARCAGSPTAMLLARAGHSVLVVDRATFPSDTLSTHFVTPDGAALLAEWGLLDRIVASGCPPVVEMRMRIGPTVMPNLARSAPGICPRRTILDQMLVEAAREAGATVREGFSVTGLTFDGDRVTGIEGHNADGTAVSESARMVIGADGKNSVVAKAVDAPEYNVVPGATCGYFSYWSGIESEGASEIRIADDRAILLFPTHEGRTCVILMRPAAEFPTWKQDIEGYMLARIEEVEPETARRLRAGKREERFQGLIVSPGFYRKPYGPGWALAGDAGYHKDPILGQGMTDAFRDAAMLSAALIAGFAGKQPMEEALAGFEAQRNGATAVMYQLTNMLAGNLNPGPEIGMMMQMGMQAQLAAAGQ